MTQTGAVTNEWTAAEHGLQTVPALREEPSLDHARKSNARRLIYAMALCRHHPRVRLDLPGTEVQRAAAGGERAEVATAQGSSNRKLELPRCVTVC